MRVLILALVALLPMSAAASGGKLLATPGVTTFEGTAGGGIVPWAMLAGYATREETAVSGFVTTAPVDDFRLDAAGLAFNLHDRVELSYARHRLTVEPLSTEITQDVFGVKWRLAGDIVYSRWPQVSLGLQYKRLSDPSIAFAVGARDEDGFDAYITASKLHLGAVFGRNLLWSAGVRATRANQAGLLGFGGDDDDDHALMPEASLAVFFNRRVAVGVEYRAKPDNLAAVTEDDWMDVFLAVFPNKRVNVTLAWVNLGEIAGTRPQRGAYVSVTGYFH